MANLEILYEILRTWALAGEPRTYGQLSAQYFARAGHWVQPHLGWDDSLGTLNNMLAGAHAPAITALVILQDANEPGRGFWGCAPTVPPRPATDNQRLAEWVRILNDVRAYPWPPTLNGLVGALA